MPAPLRDMPQEGIELIKSFEGIPDGDPSTVNLDPYLDPLDIWTVGWGHAITSGGAFVRGAANRALARSLFPGGITVPQAEALLRGDLVSRAGALMSLVRVPLDDNQFAALMSFVFNCGAANLGASTLLKLLNAGNTAGAADQFLVWNKGRKNGVLVELPGLTRRRRAERALFLGQDWRAVAAQPVTRERGGPVRGIPRREVPEPPTAAEATAARKANAAAARSARGPVVPAKKVVAKKTVAKKAAPAAAKKSPVKKAAPKRKAK
jgi:GH24 family phage-related lysozyme (muramidase)